jgi:hypothetical protein
MSGLPKKGEVTPDAPKVLSRLDLNDSQWFLSREDGLRFVEKVARKPGEQPAEVATQLTFEPFEVAGRLVPIDGDNQRGLLVRIGKREVTVPRANIASEADTAKWLSDHGVRFDSRKKGLLSLYFSAANAAVITAYTRNGWQRDGAFVVGDMIIRGEGRVLATETHVSRFEQRGTFEHWQEEVLSLARMKPGWLFGILVGLSSPLLRIVGSQTGYGFNLTGRSSIGKTASLQASANVWGRPDASGCLRSFNTTVNGIEGLAEAHNDVGLPLDEMKKGDPAHVRDSVYMLANGSGKVAMRSNRELLRTRHWLVNTFTSSEKTIEDMFDAEGQHQAAGQVVRFIDVQGEPLLPDLPLDDVKRFEQALIGCYGVAGPEFVRRLMAHPDGDVRRRWTEATRALYAGADNRIERAAAGFGLLVVAGEIMSIETAVVKQAFDAWLLTGVEAALDDNVMILRAIRDHVDANLGSSILPLSQEDDEFDPTGEAGLSYRARDGWFIGEGDEMAVFLLPPVLDRLRDGHGKTTFYGWLKDRELIRKRSDRGNTVRVPRLKKQTYAVAFNWANVRAELDAHFS